MPNTIAKVKNDKKENVETTLDIKIVTKIHDSLYIVGDESENVLLESSQTLQESMTYKLLKPRFLNDKLHDNPKFKILKAKTSIQTKTLTAKEIKYYNEIANIEPKKKKSDQKVILTNFTDCETLTEKDRIEKLTVLIISKSGDIEGKFGKYHIVTAKDYEGKKNSLSIYHDKTKKVQPENLITLTALKKQSFKKADEEFHRLGTTWKTQIFEAIEEEKEQFKNVMLGDEKTRVNILGFENLKKYESCQKCWTKLSDKYCKKCLKEVDENYAWDFYVTLYVQDVDNEENIMEVFSFKKDLNVQIEEKEDLDKCLEDLTGQTVSIEYNKPKDEGRYKLVRLHKDE